MAAGSNKTKPFKVLVLGESTVGKSSILKRLIHNVFDRKIAGTTGISCNPAVVSVDGNSIEMALWDAPGHEHFDALHRAFYRTADAAIFVFDIGKSETFDELTEWLANMERLRRNPHFVKIMVGNKADTKARRVTREMAEEFARKHSMLYVEASALTGDGVQTTFDQLAKKLLEVAAKMTKKAHADGSKLYPLAKTTATVVAVSPRSQFVKSSVTNRGGTANVGHGTTSLLVKSAAGDSHVFAQGPRELPREEWINKNLRKGYGDHVDEIKMRELPRHYEKAFQAALGADKTKSTVIGHGSTAAVTVGSEDWEHRDKKTPALSHDASVVPSPAKPRRPRPMFFYGIRDVTSYDKDDLFPMQKITEKFTRPWTAGGKFQTFVKKIFKK